MQENSSFQMESASRVASQSAPKEKANSFYSSIGILAIVIIATIIFGALTFRTNSLINETQAQIDDMKAQITQLKSDKKNSVASLVTEDTTIDSVRLSPLIENFSQIAAKYQVQLQNFSIKDNIISTNLTARNSDKDAVQKIITMMNEFAKMGQIGNFALEPIFSISGDANTRTAPITFKIVPIKPITPQADENSETLSN